MRGDSAFVISALLFAALLVASNACAEGQCPAGQYPSAIKGLAGMARFLEQWELPANPDLLASAEDAAEAWKFAQQSCGDTGGWACQVAYEDCTKPVYESF